MVEEDYIMRLIKEMVRSILKMLFHIDMEIPTVDLLEDEESKNQIKSLLELVDEGCINDAENQLHELIADETMNNLEMALVFYSYLNEKNDDFLEKNDFSREEIKMGLIDVLGNYGMDSMTDAFLSEM